MIKMKKPLFIIIILFFVSVAVGLGTYGTIIALSRQPVKQVVKVEKEKSKNNKPTKKVDNADFSIIGKVDFTNEECVYNSMHYMINTKIESNAIWGTLEITKNRVGILIKAVNASNWSDKEKLLEILNRWENDDFSQAVEDHNYVWSKLDGNIGKATGVKK